MLAEPLRPMAVTIEHLNQLDARIASLEADKREAEKLNVRARIATLERAIEADQQRRQRSEDGAAKGRKNLCQYRGFDSITHYSGDHDEYDDWVHRVKMFLEMEHEAFGEMFEYMEKLDREVVQADYVHFMENHVDVDKELWSWMNLQLYSLLSLKCKDGPLQTVKNMLSTKDDNIKGIKTWCKILLSIKGHNANRSQMLTERVHNVKQVKSYAEIPQLSRDTKPR